MLASKSIPLKSLSFFFRFLKQNWCQLSPRDILHAEQLGLLKKELSHIFKELLEPEAIDKIKSILHQSVFPKGETNLGNKLDKISNFNGREIKTLIYVLPFALFSLNESEELCFKCFMTHCYYYRLLSQSKVKKSEKEFIQGLIEDHHKLYAELYPGI